MSKWCLTIVAVFGLGIGLRAQGPSDLGPKEKTEVFIQHLVKVAKLDPARYKALVLEYEIGTALVEMAKEHDETEAEHAQGGHEDGDDCCSGPTLGASAINQNFIQTALREIHPEYAQALKHAEEGRLGEAREIAKSLSLKSDPYLAAHAGLLQAECELALAKAAKDADAFLRIIEVCEKISQRDRLYLIEDHRTCELIALCFEAIGKKLEESTQYAILLTDYNDLPKEVSDRAKARLAALEGETGRPLGTVATWMNHVEKLLGEEKTAKDPTQSQEIEIVSALDKLIELQEARER